MSRKAVRFAPLGTTTLFALCALVLMHPETSRGVGPSGSVTVCKVSGSASAPDLAEVSVSVDQLASYLNQNAGSFVGSCAASPGGSADSSTPLSGTATVCRVSGSADAPILSEVTLAADQTALYLSQNPGSFAGTCPPPSGGNATASSGSAGPVSAVVTVCRVTGNADGPGVAQLNLAVNDVAAFVDRNPGSFIGTCPGAGATATSGPGRILGIPVGGALSICRVTADGKVLDFAQVNVAIDQVAVYLDQSPGSFVGLCPSSADPNGTIGDPPLGYVTVCRVTGDAGTPLAPVTVRRDGLRAYLTRAGTVLDPSSSGCASSSRRPAEPPATVPVGQSSTVVVNTTPNTVVTATGAGVKQTTKSKKSGRATLRVRPKRQGKISIRGANGRVVKTLGAASTRRSGGALTG